MTYAVSHPDTITPAQPAAQRNVTKWILALMLFFSLLAFFTALQVFQLTSRGPAERTLRRAVATVSEIDLLLDRHYDDLRERADAVAPTATLELQDFPVAVPLSPAEVQSQSRDQLRETLLDRAAARMYEHGTDAMRNDASTGDPGVFSAGGTVDFLLDLLRKDAHTAAGVLMVILGVISLLLAAALAAAARGFGRAVAVSAVALASSVVLLLFAILGSASLHTGAGSEYLQHQLVDLAGDLAWLPVRNAAILVVCSALITALAAVAARLSDTRLPARPIP